MNRKVIGYIRVSTQKQGNSGLGMEAQSSAVKVYAGSIGAEIVAWYCEVESGKRGDRPELAKAIAHAKHSDAKLVIAKLDRLARNVAFTSAVMDGGADFVCCDNPHATRLTLHILAAMAEHEAEQISARTRAALAAAKARGVKLGSSREGHWDDPKRAKARLVGIRHAAKNAAKLRTESARTAYLHLEPPILAFAREGLSLRAIAAKLNEQGHRTRRGMEWNPVQVGRVIERMEARGIRVDASASATSQNSGSGRSRTLSKGRN